MIDLVAGPIHGYRVWKSDFDGALRSLNDDKVWLPGRPAQAVCYAKASDTHVPAAPGCTCGWYALKEPGQNLIGVDSRCVIGKVALWGRVIEHEHGYRAEFGYPVEVWSASPRILTKVLEAYGCRKGSPSLSQTLPSSAAPNLAEIIRRFGLPQSIWREWPWRIPARLFHYRQKRNTYSSSCQPYGIPNEAFAIVLEAAPMFQRITCRVEMYESESLPRAGYAVGEVNELVWIIATWTYSW